MANKNSYEQKKMSNGADNPKYIDMLDEDNAIANQKFVCISFVSPEKILKNREHYLFQEFLKTWDFNKSMEKFNQFINFIAYKYELDGTSLNNDFKDFLKEEKDKLDAIDITEEFKTYLDANEDKLTDIFNDANQFQTSVRGIKVRGTYSTQSEAEARAKSLREIDPNFDIYVGPVGVWMPWEPDAYKTGKVEHLEEELNKLVNEKQENEVAAKEYFERRVKETKRAAIEDNKKKALDSGNRLTQNIDNNDNLYNVGNNVVIDSDPGSPTAKADIRKELFEADNIIPEYAKSAAAAAATDDSTVASTPVNDKDKVNKVD
tara:strand:+ start:18311 stop:19267 length:957 start_codon:yes stop_codon:yes gene_type:complete